MSALDVATALGREERRKRKKTRKGSREGYGTQSYKFLFVKRQPLRKKAAFLMQNALVGMYGASAILVATGPMPPSTQQHERAIGAVVLGAFAYQAWLIANHTAYRWWHK